MNDQLTIVVIVILIALSAFFSATETAFTSSSRSKLSVLRDGGSKSAGLVLSLMDKYDKFLSAILIGNNIVNIGASSIGTLLFVRKLGDVGASVSTAVITVVVLIFGEITPKSAAKENPEKFAMFAAPAVAALMWVFTPLIAVFSAWTKLVSRLFGGGSDRRVTDEELIAIVDEVCEEGGIDENKSELIRSSIEFSDSDVNDIMTPRVDIAGVPDDVSLKELIATFRDTGYSRLPVYHDTIDNIIGIMHQKDLYDIARGESFDICKYVKKPVFVPESIKIDRLLKTMQKEKEHMAIVLDEHGGTLGLVTMENIIEELVGDIWDEHDKVVEDIKELPDGGYRILGSAALDDVLEVLSMGEQDTECTTMSGWLADELGVIPKKGDSFEKDGYRFTVSEADGKKADEVIVTRIAPAPEAGEAPAAEDSPEK